MAGTPDPGPDNGPPDCNTHSTFGVEPTGSRSSCVSADGTFDMVGNLEEWVADWIPRSTTCGSWSESGDLQCLAGADPTGEPGALLRGGANILYDGGASAGPLSVEGLYGPSGSVTFNFNFGFRCAR